MPKIHIVGAGLSGMVAAINLAREGYEVLILEGHHEIGGMKDIHPSAHTTPIDVQAASNYTGIDLSACFKPILDFRMGVLDRLYRCSSDTLFCVERGNRPTAMDTYLYEECLRLGVKFSFNTMVGNPLTLPPDTVIATGLHPETFDILGIPYEKVYSFWMWAERSSGIFETLKTEFEQLLVGYMDNYTNDYFYITAVNDMWYALLFSRKPLFKTHLADCIEKVHDRLGVALTGWRFLTGCIPSKRIDNPVLFLGDKIITGSLSGTMDPMFLFGIHGALMSGKVAAMAVRDPVMAQQEFRKLNRFYIPTLVQRRIHERNIFRNNIANFLMTRVPRTMCQISRLATLGVPGYRSFKPMIRSIQREN